MYEIKNTVYCKGQGWRSKLINSQTKLHLKWFLIAQKAVSKFWIFKARIMVYLMGLMRFNTYPCFDVLAKACPTFECYLQINNHWKSAIQNCTWKLKRIIPQTDVYFANHWLSVPPSTENRNQSISKLYFCIYKSTRKLKIATTGVSFLAYFRVIQWTLMFFKTWNKKISFLFLV